MAAGADASGRSGAGSSGREGARARATAGARAPGRGQPQTHAGAGSRRRARAGASSRRPARARAGRRGQEGQQRPAGARGQAGQQRAASGPRGQTLGRALEAWGRARAISRADRAVRSGLCKRSSRRDMGALEGLSSENEGSQMENRTKIYLCCRSFSATGSARTSASLIVLVSDGFTFFPASLVVFDTSRCFFAFVVPVGAAASSFSLFLSARNSHREFAANVTIFFSPSLFLLAWKSRREFAAQVPFFGFLDAAAALVFSCMGAAYRTAKSGVGVALMDVMRPELVMKSIVSMVMAGVLGIYGLIIVVIISTGINPKAKSYYLFNGYAHLNFGLACGLVGLSAGMAIDIVGDARVRANAQQPKLFVGMILIVIFAKALALYGLIVGIILSSRTEHCHICIWLQLSCKQISTVQVCISEAWKLYKYDWMHKALVACIMALSHRIILFNDN
ncbi:hypothetical protein IEQ34_012374 [Dendrobium chrysotoxum]|uniref:V-type proton ATPase proteolipid subunit n=1 Tax=Dendrobium chrysotoxum TaxID=161865 RepID=A0AAV7GWF2_DENCH|nr:hypothetical protein IEQ34_012374 [Dendrobium chrysotoxum]